jgi:NADPH-dependent curcumin reductase CurA
MSQSTNREIHLASRPTGMPKAENFKLVETPMPKTGQGQFLIRNILMSVDPYMRGRMMDRESYIPPYQVGQVLDGGAVGQVVESQHAGFAAGDYVCGFASGNSCRQRIPHRRVPAVQDQSSGGNHTGVPSRGECLWKKMIGKSRLAGFDEGNWR